MTFLLLLALVIVLAPLVSAAARRLDPPKVAGVTPSDLAKLREDVDQLSVQLDRLQEEQSFLLRLLAEGEKERRDELGPGDGNDATPGG